MSNYLEPHEQELAEQRAADAKQFKFEEAWKVVRDMTPGAIVRDVGTTGIHVRFPRNMQTLKSEQELCFLPADAPILRAVLALLEK